MQKTALALPVALLWAGLFAGCGAKASGSDAALAAPPTDDSDLNDGKPNLNFWMDGQFIRDKQGRAVILRGINVSNLYKYPEYVTREPDYIGEEGYQHIAASGFNAVRLITEWYGIEPEEGVYDEGYLNVVARRIDWATKAGLYVLIDMHQDVFGIGFGDNGAPAWACDEANYESYTPVEPWFANYNAPQVQACYTNFWNSEDLQRHLWEAAKAIGDRVANNPLVLGFDTFNEPGWGVPDPLVLERDFLWPYNLGFAETVGAAASGRMIFFEPTVMFNWVYATWFPGEIKDFPGVFAPHYYNPSINTSSLYDEDDNAVRNVVAGTAAEAARLGVPWVIGEFGGSVQTPNLARYFNVLYGALDEVFAGAFLYDYTLSGQGNGYLVSGDRTWHPSAKGFLRPAPSAIAGKPLAFSWDYNALRFALDWEEDTEVGDTEIILPAWVSQVGYQLQVDGSTVAPLLSANGARAIIPGGRGGRRTALLTANAPYPE